MLDEEERSRRKARLPCPGEGTYDFLADRECDWDWGEPAKDREPVADQIARFTASSLPSDVAEVVAPVVREIAPKVAFTSRAARSTTSMLAQFFWWCFREGIPVDPTSLHPDVIDRFIVEGCAHMAAGTRSNYKSLLRRCGAAVLGRAWYPPPGVGTGHSPLQTPYADRDIPAIAAWARGLSTPKRRVNMETLLALGFGTGMFPLEVLGAAGTDVRIDDEGVLVDVNVGRHQRTIPVLRAWEENVAAIAARVGSAPMFLPDRQVTRRDHIGRFIMQSSQSSAPRLVMTRARSTWIVHHLRSNTSFRAIRALESAAGISANQIGAYARFLPPADVLEFRQQLRNASTQ